MSKIKTSEIFIEKAKIIHDNKYNYSLVKYISWCDKVKIICPLHGEFEQTPNKHLSKKGCKKCGFISRCNLTRSNSNEFVIKANKVHDNKYSYHEVSYVGRGIKVKVNCQKHGLFEQTPHNHLAGNGCPKCNESHGEKNIRKFLTDNKINFVPQKRFENCRNILPLPFDFYLPDYQVCIEYQGIQHFKSRSKFGGSVEYTKLQLRDNIKSKYCEENGLQLILISYKDDVQKRLTSFHTTNILKTTT